MKHVMIIVGARPNFMKAAPLMEAMRRTKHFQVRLVHTGQHFDDNMSKIFFDEFRLPKPNAYLDINRESHTNQLARTMIALESEFKKWMPDLVVVVGDVNSTLAAAITANKMSIKLAHVEAGLRSFDRTMPEEINRLLVDQIADYLFTPSPDADDNLKREGVSSKRIFRVGNVMVDTLMRFRERAEHLKVWERHGLSPRGYGVVTLHRPSNVDQPSTLAEIVEALVAIQGQLPLLFPVHPRTKAKLKESGWLDKLRAHANLILTEPISYVENLSVMTQARLAITDSGGIQEETTVLGVPCLTVRRNTERPITISQGTNQLVGQSKKNILDAVRAVTNGRYKPKQPKLWDGHAADRIVKILSA